MRSGESTPQMSFDLDRNTEDKKNTTTNESLSRRKMLRQNSDSGFSGFLKKFDQATDFTKRTLARQPSLASSFQVPKDDFEDLNGCMSDNVDYVSRTPRSVMNDILMVPDSPRYTAGNRGPEPSFGGGLRVETPKHSAFAFPSQLNRGQLRREMTLNYESLRDSVKDSPKNLEKTTKTSSATSSRYKTHETSRSGSVDAEDDDIPDTQLTDLPANQQKMVLILDKMLSHRHVHESDLSEFSTVDFEILRAIVHRKYKVTLTNQDIKKIGSAVDLLNKVDELQFESKRSEENNKLVFKRALKYLINQYRKDHSKELKHLRKKEYEALICKEYFGSVPLPDTKKSKSKSKDELDGSRIKGQRKGAAKKSEPTLKQEEKIRGFVINPNTINSKYINFVFGSESFKEFFYQFIEQHFLADYGGARKHKLVKIVEHLYEKESTNGVKDAMQYIEHNAKFKIPWSDKELNVGVRSTREFIGRVQKKVEKTKASKTAADKRSKTSLRNAS